MTRNSDDSSLGGVSRARGRVTFPLARPEVTRGKAQLTTLLIARSILEAIDTEQLVPGDPLPAEAELARQLGVGKGSVREALRLLEVHGFVVVKAGAGGGPRVSDPELALGFAHAATLFLQQSGARLTELLEARVQLEPLMARLAASAGHNDRLEALRQVYEQARHLDLSDHREYKDITVAFHHLIGGASGNKVLDLFGRGVLEVFYDGLPDALLPTESREGVLEEHARIAEAIFAGDADLAASLMQTHLEAIRDGLRDRFPEMLERVITWQ